MIFDEATIHKLSALTLVARQMRAGLIKGERRSTKRGASVEFADYRDYSPGDDLRRLDWNIYARLDRPFIKLLEEEEDLAVHILVDASQSMDWGEGEANKFHFALRLAAALGAIALTTGDQMTLALLTWQPEQLEYGPARSQQHLLPMLAFLETRVSQGSTDLNYSLKNYAMSARRPGLAFLISDLFSPSGFQEGLHLLQGRGYEFNLLHLLSPDEIDPPLAGDLRLRDIETGEIQEVTMDGELRSQYRQRLEAWQVQIQVDCQKHQIRYLPISTSQKWDELVLLGLRQAGMVK